MAVIRIYDDETDGETFPARCLKCGEDTDNWVTRRFSWVPGWTIVIILAGLLPYVIVVAILRKYMKVTVPMCPRHTGHWRNRSLFVWLGLLFWVAYMFALAALADELPREAMHAALAILIFGGLFWLITAAIYSTSGIQPNEITDDWIELKKVNKSVAEDWLEVEAPSRPRKKRR